MTSVTVYDGATTIGGNKIYVEDNGRGVFLDFGTNFAKYGEYFEDFLAERSGRGIHDLVHLGLIPKINIYREDLVPPDLDISAYTSLAAEAVLLSHAHLDHCGNVGFISESMPIIASSTSIGILKALRDTSQSKIGLEIAYISPKIKDGLIIKSDSSKKTPYIGRNLCCVSEPSGDLEKFLSEKPGQSSKTKQLEPGKLFSLPDLDLPFEIRAYDVDHSIYGAVSYILDGNVTIAYTGDFRFHGKTADKTRAFIKAAKDASIFITEGTRAERQEINESEEIVHQNCLKAVEESNGLVIADFSPRNFERLTTFGEIADRTGRELCITGKDAYMLHAIECAGEICKLNKFLIYDELKDKSRDKWESELDNNRVNHIEISNNPQNYILCFSFYDLKHLLDIKPDGGSYIYSS
ncbi:MAG: ribonuclease J, partial [Methanotrichaceae archaeon]|nr:ribonuclease J [Methanotrichaceae archaeon]